MASPQVHLKQLQLQVIDNPMKELLGTGASAEAFALVLRVSSKEDTNAETVMSRPIVAGFSRLHQQYVPEMSLFNYIEEVRMTAEKAGKTCCFANVDFAAPATRLAWKPLEVVGCRIMFPGETVVFLAANENVKTVGDFAWIFRGATEQRRFFSSVSAW